MGFPRIWFAHVSSDSLFYIVTLSFILVGAKGSFNEFVNSTFLF